MPSAWAECRRARPCLPAELGVAHPVVSGYYAYWELGRRPDTHGHFVAKDMKESCALAVQAAPPRRLEILRQEGMVPVCEIMCF